MKIEVYILETVKTSYTVEVPDDTTDFLVAIESADEDSKESTDFEEYQGDARTCLIVDYETLDVKYSN